MYPMGVVVEAVASDEHRPLYWFVVSDVALTIVLTVVVFPVLPVQSAHVLAMLPFWKIPNTYVALACGISVCSDSERPPEVQNCE